MPSAQCQIGLAGPACGGYQPRSRRQRRAITSPLNASSGTSLGALPEPRELGQPVVLEGRLAVSWHHKPEVLEGV